MSLDRVIRFRLSVVDMFVYVYVLNNNYFSETTIVSEGDSI